MVALIPVARQPEPPSFHERVRAPGLDWIHRHGLDPNQAPPPRTELKATWRESLDELHAAYGGVCAYLAIFIERVAGATSVDHFQPMASSPLKLAYEWSNYRLCSSGLNGRKGLKRILDPFHLRPDTFRLELVSGRIFPSPDLPPKLLQDAQATLSALRLDDPYCRELRARRVDEYIRREVSADYLRRTAPFVYFELQRQGLL